MSLWLLSGTTLISTPRPVICSAPVAYCSTYSVPSSSNARSMMFLEAGEEGLVQREGVRHGIGRRIETVDIRALVGERDAGQFPDVVRAVRTGDDARRHGVARLLGRRRREGRTRRRRAPRRERRQ